MEATRQLVRVTLLVSAVLESDLDSGDTMGASSALAPERRRSVGVSDVFHGWRLVAW